MKKIFLLPFAILISLSLAAQFGYPTQISNSYEICNFPDRVVPADMDNDGDIDLVVASQLETDVVWFENLNGKGDYGNPMIVEEDDPSMPAENINNLQVADLNNDGDLDIVVLSGDQVFWYKNTVKASANFSDRLTLPTLTYDSKEFLVGDINGDNNLDILVIQGGSSGNDSSLGWYQSIDGSDEFEEFEILTDTAYKVVDLVDLDNDGDLDIITSTYLAIGQGFYPTVLMIENIDGSFDFDNNTIIAENVPHIESIQFHDLDTDGDLDLLLYTFDSKLNWYKNIDGQGIMGDEIVLSDSLMYGTAPPTVLDYDNDGDLDLVMTDGTKQMLYDNVNGQGDFEPLLQLQDNRKTADHLYSTDINNDGNQDILSINREGFDRSLGFIIKNEGGGEFAAPIDFIGGIGRVQEKSNNRFISSHDLDEDGAPELIVASNKLGWQKFTNSPLKFDNQNILPFKMSGLGGVDYADMDGDGDQDFIATISLTAYNDRLVWFEKNSTVPIDFDQMHELFIGSDGLRNVSVSDIDSDGDLDVITNVKPTNGLSASGVFFVENVDGLGNFLPAVEVADSYDFVLFEDMDEDGDLDIMFSKNLGLTQGFQIGLHSNENGSFGSSTILTTPLAIINGFEYKDMDNDGLKDIVYFFENELLWHKNLGGTFNSASIYHSAMEEIKDVIFVDYNFDGMEDFYLVAGSELKYFENSGNSSGFNTPLITTMPDSETTEIYFEDFDGDRDLDLISYSLSKKHMYYHENLSDLPSVVGKVYYDENENSNYDVGEVQLYLQSVEIQPTAVSTLSSPSGDFYFAVGNGTYDISCYPSQQFTFTSPSSVNVAITDDLDTEVYFGLKPLAEDLEATVEMVSGPTRCGFEVPFWIDYKNQGTVIADATVYVTLDPLVAFVSSIPTPDSIVGNNVYWNIENVPPTHSGQIQMTLQMPGVEHIGEWISMTAYNQMTSNDGSLTSVGTSGFRSQINCAYDPNDKMVEPNIPNHDNYTLLGDTLKYVVRFQNTGTDTAFTVRIEDYLDPNLNWSSLQVLGTSHPYLVTLDQHTGRLLFTFENILLPDSTTNEIASHGYVHFQINHIDGLPERTYIENTAGIYFDFNPPIITNTVENILVSQYPLIINVDQPTCHGDNDGSVNVVFDIPLFETYQWDNGETSSSLDSLSAGIYHLTITTSNGAQIDTSISVIDPPLFNPSNFGLFDISCFGEEDGKIIIQPLGGVPNYFFEWSNGNTTSHNTDLAAGQYLVTVSDANGCVGKDTFDIVEPDEIIINAEVNNLVCYDGNDGAIDPFIQGGTPGYTYLWSNSSIQSDLTLLSPGTYTLTVIDGNGCTKVREIEVDSPPPIILNTATTPANTGMNGSATVQPTGGVPPYSYAWDHDGTLSDSIIYNLPIGDYTVTVTDANNCSQSVIISVEEMTNVLSLSQNLYFNVSPNPSYGEINIEFEFSASQLWQLQIFNSLGQSVKVISSPRNGSKSGNWKLDLPEGNYMVSLFVENKLLRTSKIIIH